LVRKSVVVNVSLERPWEGLTAQMGSWWPLESHSVLAEQGKQAERLVVEGGIGGEIFEQFGNERVVWATVLVWEPPHRFAVRWRVTPTALTEWAATVTPEGEGTLVDRVHRGWETHGERAEAIRSNYADEGGWPTVLGCFERFANRGRDRVITAAVKVEDGG